MVTTFIPTSLPSPLSYSPTKALKFVATTDILLGGGYPRWNSTAGHMVLLLVVKYPKNNALCAAAAAAGTRQKRGVVLASNEAALSQAVLLQIMMDVDL
jgi:hypothetical protein